MILLEILITLIIIGIAGGVIYKNFFSKSSKGCGCGGCSPKSKK